MKITVEFNDFKEMAEFAAKFPGTAVRKNAAENVVKDVNEIIDQAAEQKAAAQPQTPAAEPQAPAKNYTLTEVRAALAKLAKSDPAKVKEILQAVGAEKLTDVKERDYALIMEKAGV